MKKLLHRMTRAALALGIASLFASCVHNTSNIAPTQYLEAFAPGSVPGSGSAYDQDSVSYWDGDGMSGPASVVIDLSDQKAYFYKGDQLAGVSALSTGDEGHPTTTGNFKIIQKDKWHRSNLYGDFVDANDNVVVRDVTAGKDIPPPGTRFLGSKMTHFMRFNGGAGMHEGYLPGYAASHGCVRMPAHMAEIFFNNVSLGTPVRVQM